MYDWGANLIEQGEMRRAMRGRGCQKILVSEGKDLRVDGVAHQVEPGTREIGIVSRLLARAAGGDDLLERFIIPEIGLLEDHWYRLEIASAQPARQIGELL